MEDGALYAITSLLGFLGLFHRLKHILHILFEQPFLDPRPKIPEIRVVEQEDLDSFEESELETDSGENEERACDVLDTA
ncbi:MAG: hypothetical protein AAB853_00620 [Patescibacteria group bacterium]